MAPQASRYTNQFLQLSNVDHFPKSYQSPQQFPSSTLERHLKNKTSIIPEATEEYIQYTSNTPERLGEKNYAFNTSSIKESLKKTKKNVPEEEDNMSKSRKSLGLSMTKKSVTKKSG